MTLSPKIRRFGGSLALCALWFQIVLSFGHLHAQDVWGPTGFQIGHDAGPAEAVGDHHHQQPAQDQADLELDGCAVCASMAMLGTGLLPDPVKLSKPYEQGLRLIAHVTSHVFTAALRLPFQPRAPPKI